MRTPCNGQRRRPSSVAHVAWWVSAPDWGRSFAVGDPSGGGAGHRSFVDRLREWPLHLRHRSLDRCGQRMASGCLRPLPLVVRTRPIADIRPSVLCPARRTRASRATGIDGASVASALATRGVGGPVMPRPTTSPMLIVTFKPAARVGNDGRG